MRSAVSLTRLRAASGSDAILAYLRTPHTGLVIATFARSCYLDLDGRIIALVSPDLSNGPLNLVLSPAPVFAHLSVGTLVRSTAERLRVGEEWDVKLVGASGWDPVLRRIDPIAAPYLWTHLSSLDTLMDAEAPLEGLGRVCIQPTKGDLTSLEQSGVSALTDLSHGLQKANPEQLARGAHALAGLGPGLTPSGDDVLVGCLLALAVLPNTNPGPLREAIISSARGRTTRIGEAYLNAAARGEASEAWHHLISSLQTPDAVPLIGAARQILAVGETSGSDMLGGFVLASRVLLRIDQLSPDITYSAGN